MILCDTDILIEFYKNNVSVAQKLRHIGLSQLSISSITRAELYFSALNKAELQKIKKHLSLIREFEIDVAICDRFLQLMENYSLSHALTIPDALIAATAIRTPVGALHAQLEGFPLHQRVEVTRRVR